MIFAQFTTPQTVRRPRLTAAMLLACSCALLTLATDLRAQEQAGAVLSETTPTEEGPVVQAPTTGAPIQNKVAPLPKRPDKAAKTAKGPKTAEPAQPALPANFDSLGRDEQLSLLVDRQVQAASFLLVDARTGETLLSRDPHGQYPPASTTKLLTALLAYELVGLDGNVTVTVEDTKVEPSHVPLIPGEVIPTRELIYSTLIGSDNDSAVALGRHAAGSMPRFMEMMNKYAQALGCEESEFKNPNGLPDVGHLSSATDLMKIFQRVLERPALRQICVTKEFPLTTLKGTQIVKNHNKLLGRYIGMGPAKTGWTRASQHTYAAAATRGDRTFHLTLLKSPNKWVDATVLFNYAFTVRPASPESLPPGVPAVPLMVQDRSILVAPGGEVRKGEAPPEGLVIITGRLPGSALASARAAAVTAPVPPSPGVATAQATAATSAVSQGDAEAELTEPAPVTVRPSKPVVARKNGIVQTSDGTSYMADAFDRAAEEGPTVSTSGKAVPLKSATTARAPEGYVLTDYTVRSGDSLAQIAARHGCTVEMIERYNTSIGNRHRISPGQHLRVPKRQE